MHEASTDKGQPRHLRVDAPSPWIARFAHLIPEGGAVLDLACGGGRHAALLGETGCRVTAVDRDVAAIRERLAAGDALEIVEADLEDGPPPFGPDGALHDRTFDGIVVVNYLHRPLFPALLRALRPGGALLYETFARGNEVYAKPRNPDHLLRAGELLAVAGERLQIVAYEHGLLAEGDIPGVKQRIAAVNDRHPVRSDEDAGDERSDGEPPPHSIDP